MELNTLNAINWIFEDTFNGSMAMKNSKEKVADLVLYNHCNRALFNESIFNEESNDTYLILSMFVFYYINWSNSKYFDSPRKLE